MTTVPAAAAGALAADPTSAPDLNVEAGVRWCACGAAVRRVATRSGWVALEVDACADGNVVPGRGADGLVIGRVLTEVAAAVYKGPRWRPHLPQCPAAVPAVPLRSRPGGLELSNVECPGCRQLLPVVLLRVAESSHPSCCPDG